MPRNGGEKRWRDKQTMPNAVIMPLRKVEAANEECLAKDGDGKWILNSNRLSPSDARWTMASEGFSLSWQTGIPIQRPFIRGNPLADRLTQIAAHRSPIIGAMGRIRWSFCNLALSASFNYWPAIDSEVTTWGFSQVDNGLLFTRIQSNHWNASIYRFHWDAIAGYCIPKLMK